MTTPKSYSLNVKFLRKILIAADDIIHFLVAVTLLIVATLILFQTIPALLSPDRISIIHVLNDVLLVLIVMELVWPIIRFLKREAFSLNSFLYIGIISSVRRILMIEAEHSMLSDSATKDLEHLLPILAELGASVLIIVVLAIALRLVATKQVDV